MQDKVKTQIHERAISRGKKYLQSEREVLESIQEVWESKVYYDYQCRNLHEYVVKFMGLSDAVAASFIAVAKKAIEVPALKEVIDSGKLQVQKARKVVPVITEENQSFWLDLAVNKTQREVERQVAKVKPEADRPDSVRHTSEDRLSLKHNVSERVYELVKRVKDLESQRLRKAATFEESLEAMARAYLEKHDPIEKAKRSEIRKAKKVDAEKVNGTGERTVEVNGTGEHAVEVKRVEPDCDATAPVSRQKQRNKPNEPITRKIQTTQSLRRISAELEHQISRRDGRQCVFRDERGNRCSERRWLETHHVVPISRGGLTTLENLTTLCSGHHKMTHIH